MPALIAPSPMIATALRCSPFSLRRHRHAERRRDRGRRVRGAEGVVLAFVAARKAADAAELAQRAHAVAPAGEDLVRIGLVADVPDQAVVRRVEHVVQRDRQLHRAEVARQVAAGLADRLQHELAQLGGERGSSSRDSRRRSAGTVDQWRAASSFVRAQLSRSTTLSASTASQAASVRPLLASARLRLVAQRIGTFARAAEAEHADVGRLVGVRGPCRRSCRACRTPASRRGCRRPPGTRGRSPRRSRPARARRRWSCRRRTAPISTLACSSAPVLRRCMSRELRFVERPADAGQVDRLAARPCRRGPRRAPAGRQPRLQRRRRRLAAGVSTSNASACIASPASIAWASP